MVLIYNLMCLIIYGLKYFLQVLRNFFANLFVSNMSISFCPLIIHSKGTWLNFLSWFRPQCQSSNILKKSTKSIATCSMNSWLYWFWYIIIYVSFRIPASICLPKNLCYCLFSSSIIENIILLISETNLVVSSLWWDLECFKNAVDEYSAARTRVDGEYMQKSAHWRAILVRNMPIWDISFMSS